MNLSRGAENSQNIMLKMMEREKVVLISTGKGEGEMYACDY
jgi:hypothetical protein